ncbi:MAG: hypothetical protein QHH17_01760 [Candidatus Bathyarchaeota archaeon]|nr:hypothetical protein [Candidatus Bathyarchaeota archaeon]
MDKDAERLGRLKPEEKVNLAIGLSDFVVRVCAEGIKAQNPNITERELVEKLRERFEWSKRWRRRGV